MISVIIPIYNCERLLPRCLDSILTQSYNDFEVLLVNDGSTDGTANVCKEYVEKTEGKFRYIEKVNGGVSSARNIGINNANGEYICFVDADDYVHQDYLRCLYEAGRELDVDLVMCTIASNDDCGSLRRFNGKYEIIRSILTIRHNQGPCCKLFKRELIGPLRFNENVYMGEDTLFCVEYAKRCKTACYVPKMIYFYDMPTSSIAYRTNSKLFQKFLTLIDSRRLMLEDVSGLNASTIRLLEDEVRSAIKICAMFATIINNLSSIKSISKQAKALVAGDYDNDMEMRLLVACPVVYYLRKKFLLKADALMYRVKHIIR